MFLKGYKETSSLKIKKIGKGRKRCTTTTDDRIKEKLSQCIQNEIAQCNVQLSSKAVRCRLQAVGLNSRYPRIKGHFYLSNKGENIKLG